MGNKCALLFFSGGGGGGGGVCVCVCARVCAFFHTCNAAPKLSYMLYMDKKIYLACPVAQSVCLSVRLSLSQSLVGWFVSNNRDEHRR